MGFALNELVFILDRGPLEVASVVLKDQRAAEFVECFRRARRCIAGGKNVRNGRLQHSVLIKYKPEPIQFSSAV